MPSKMHSDKRPNVGSFNLKTLSAAVAAALLFSNAYAAGLGKLTVLSSLGQPLRAEIELSSVSKDEVGALSAKLASTEAFKQASIDFNSALSTLRFAIEQRGDRQLIRVTSTQALNEPFVDMLLELSGPNGRLVREYTFLLDPADLRTTQSAQVAPVPVPESTGSRPSAPVTQAPPAPSVSRAERPRKTPVEPAARPAKAMPPLMAEQKPESAQGDYRVRSGDTLAKIANQVKQGGVSLDQMLVALYQANPDAFVGNNMNRLKAGQILSIPDADTARGVSNPEARGIVVAQAADFNSYRSKLAGQVATSAAQKSVESKQSAGGKITAKVEEKATPASESKDKLKLSNAAPAAGANADKAAGASAEEKIAREKAVAEANARVKELEKNVGELQKLLEVKNKSLAEQQKQADATKTDAKSATSPVPPVAIAPSSTPAPAATAVPTPVPAEASPAKPAETKLEKPVAPPAPPVVTAPPVAKPKPAAPPPEPEPSFVDELLGNPLVLPGIGALLVALGALGIYRARRQKQSKQFEDSIISDSSLKANSLFGSTGGQSVDTNNSVFNSSFSPSASQLDSNEVDPVAEADVYIAYGRDAQAEEILKEALRTQPERHAVRVKLLEIYSNRKDLRAFEVLATELYGMTKGEGDDWAQAAAMGVAIDPNNPLYASGKKDTGDAPSVLVAPTQPLDEQGLATLLSSTQPDTTSLNTLDADTSYFGNTAMATETPLEPLPEEVPDPDPVPKVSSNDLDFDLDGMQEMAVPNTMPRPTPAEPPAELTSIDFDFLDTPAEKPAEQTAEPVFETMPELEPLPDPAPVADAPSIPEIQDLEFMLGDEKPSEETIVSDISLDAGTPAVEETALDINIPDLDEPLMPLEETKPETAATDPLDFDLSGISLELNPSASKAADDNGSATNDAISMSDSVPSEPLHDLDFEAMDTQMLTDDASSNSSEMATKLDLAIAYQEIGDKEGARELLDEVLKGGTPEQSERAKNLLLELA